MNRDVCEWCGSDAATERCCGHAVDRLDNEGIEK